MTALSPPDWTSYRRIGWIERYTLTLDPSPVISVKLLDNDFVSTMRMEPETYALIDRAVRKVEQVIVGLKAGDDYPIRLANPERDAAFRAEYRAGLAQAEREQEIAEDKARVAVEADRVLLAIMLWCAMALAYEEALYDEPAHAGGPYPHR